MLLLLLLVLQVSAWNIISAIAPVVVPFLTLALAALGKIVWDMHQRISDLEENSSRQSRTIYGDEKDPQHPGLSQDIVSIEEHIDYLEDRVDVLERRVNNLKEDISDLLPD